MWQICPENRYVQLNCFQPNNNGDVWVLNEAFKETHFTDLWVVIPCLYSLVFWLVPATLRCNSYSNWIWNCICQVAGWISSVGKSNSCGSLFQISFPVSLLLWDWAVYEWITRLPTVARPHSQNEQVTRPRTLGDWLKLLKTPIIFGQWLKSVRTMEYNSNSILWLHGDAAIWRNWQIITWLHSTQRNLAAQVLNLTGWV